MFAGEQQPVRAGHDDGFTLLELLVVLGIMSLVVVSAYSLRTPRSGSIALKTVAHDIAAHLRSARAAAIKRNSEQVFWLDLANGTFWSEPASKKVKLPSGTRTRLVTAQSEIFDGRLGTIRFYPNGSSTGGAVVLDRTGGSYTVTADWMTGQISVSEHDGPIGLE